MKKNSAGRRPYHRDPAKWQRYRCWPLCAKLFETIVARLAGEAAVEVSACSPSQAEVRAAIAVRDRHNRQSDKPQWGRNIHISFRLIEELGPVIVEPEPHWLDRTA